MNSFYLDTNNAWGYVRTMDRLNNLVRILSERTRRTYPEARAYLLGARLNPRASAPSFGYRAEHSGTLTLGEWLAKQGIEV